MAQPTFPPRNPLHGLDLASEALGGFVVYATDDYFAAKENLIAVAAPVWDQERYTDRGKWMDGWESQRRRDPYAPEAHDFAVLRLGAPGCVHAFVVDTTHFRGNAPTHVAIDGIEAPADGMRARVAAMSGWREIVAKTPVQPNSENVISLSARSERFTHVRLRIYPDGGVARLRVYGDPAPDPSVFWQAGSLNLAAIEFGAKIAHVSDEFFGPPINLLLPGRGQHMGDGWETKRRRSPGADSCVIALARKGVVDRIEVDTHFFKGNAPFSCSLDAVDATDVAPDDLRTLFQGSEGWTPVFVRSPLDPHRKHTLFVSRAIVATHLRMSIHPHGGINRVRVYGTALDTEIERKALASINTLGEAALAELLRSFNGSASWCNAMSAARPFSTVSALFSKAEETWWRLGESDWREAFGAHPRIGSSQTAPSQTAQSASWSHAEQALSAGASEAIAARLLELNRTYEERFGFIYIVFATGKSALDMLETLEERLHNPAARELQIAAHEQKLITRNRIQKWILGGRS